ncbi:MAG: CCA tRNA nucleotidyltransferase [Alphaproteobacteria bacterium]|nr:CCA tRNA nucleotidyltransferase [Alphaproteobacteria bacterium]
MTRINADWLDRRLCQKLVLALGADRVRFVGGAVRDTLVGRSIKDIDAATTWLPEETKARLETAGIKVIPTGLQHGTVTAVAEGDAIEVTTLRQDVETDGRHAVVSFTDRWEEDAKRRDFTMNALYLSADGTLFDYFGGAEDAVAGRVCFIGDAAARIEEDALRIMRFFRFHAHYGTGEMNPEGLEATRRKMALLGKLSVERIRDELLKLLAADWPCDVLKSMDDIGVWPHTPLGTVDLHLLRTVIGNERRFGFEVDPIARLAGLVGEGGDPVGKTLKLSNDQRDKLSKACLGLRLRVPGNVPAMKSLIYQFGRMAGKMTVLMVVGDLEREKVDVVKEWEIPEFPMKGRDLLALGMRPGPEISKTLLVLEQEWLKSGFKIGRDALLERAAVLIG